MKLLERLEDAERSVQVFEVLRDGSRLYLDDGTLYTHVDAEGTNLLEYVTAMGCALAGAERVLVLGTAGGALATLLSRRGAEVTAIDNWPIAFEIARRWFHLPDQVECIPADALGYLRTTSLRWDAIAVDVYRGAEIPRAMLTDDVGALLAKSLAPGGRIVWNVADSPQSWAVHWIHRALRLAGFAPSLVSVLAGGVGNTLVVC
jgi:spermidine synthase